MMVKKHIPLLLITIAAMAWAIAAIVVFFSTLSEIEATLSTRRLSDITSANTAEVCFALSQHQNALEIVAVALEQFPTPQSPEGLALLSQVVQEGDYQQLSIDYKNGKSYNASGEQNDIENKAYLEKIAKGKAFVSNVNQLPISQLPLVFIVTPIYSEDGTCIAMLRGVLPTERLGQIFNKTFFLSEGYYRLVDDNGRYIAATGLEADTATGESYFSDLDTLSFLEGFSAVEMRDSILRGQQGFSQYTHQGQQRYAYWAPVGINHWTLTMVVPRDVVEESAILHRHNVYVLMAQIVLILLGIMVYTALRQRSAKNKIILNENCFRALSDNSNRTIYEWDAHTGALHTLTDLRKLFCGRAYNVRSLEHAVALGVAHPEDREKFLKMFETVREGRSFHNLQLRIKDIDGNYHWCRISGIPIFDSRSRLRRAIAFFEDVDALVKREEALSQQASEDSLTGLHNKSTTEFLIQRVLEEPLQPGRRHVLMIVDVDNFKLINDRLGHHLGDRVLSELSGQLQKIFRGDDIVGRTGGDEFFVFIKNVRGYTRIQTKGEEVCNAFRRTYGEGTRQVNVSASVGIALYPDHGTDLPTLYQNADTALYITKERGKDGFTLYDGVSESQYHAQRK